MSEKLDERLGGDWLQAVVRVLRASTGDLRELALIAGADPRTLYIGTSLAGVDLRGQDLRGMCLTGLDDKTTIVDASTLLDDPIIAEDDSAQHPPRVGQAFRNSIADAVSKALGVTLAHRRGSLFESDDGVVRAVISSSKRYHRDYQSYWYCFYDTQRRYLSEAQSAYVALAGADTGRTWALPADVIEPLLGSMGTTRRANGQVYWHIVTKLTGDGCVLVAGDLELDMTPYEI